MRVRVLSRGLTTAAVIGGAMALALPAAADITDVTVLPAKRPTAGLGKNNAGATRFADVRVRVTCAANEAGQRIVVVLSLRQGDGTGTGAGNATGSGRSDKTFCPAGGGAREITTRVFARERPASVDWRPGDGTVSGEVQTKTGQGVVTDSQNIPNTGIRLVAPQ